MKRAAVVIGANYGDEGKGRMVDYFAANISGDKTVVRFNGGAQAGHTVEVDGKRFVFGHLGSGTLAGAKTYLSKHYVCNPILFWDEVNELAAVSDVDPVVACDPRCFVTTPYDMLINQLLEDSRGAGRHGSVGVGFGETIERNNFPSFRLLKSDLKDRAGLTTKVRNIRDRWLPSRLKGLALPALPKDHPVFDDAKLSAFVEAAGKFDEAVITAGTEFFEKDAIIFEGAQGLALDQDRGHFPHVTRSNTGLTNVIPFAKGLGLDLDVVYVTRAYLTRHGAGPLAGEFKPDPPIKDPTNLDHDYQGSIRFAHMDVPALRARIEADLGSHRGIALKASLAVTCTDHVQGKVDDLRDISVVKMAYFTDSPDRSGSWGTF